MRVVAGTDSRITSPEFEQDRAAIRAALDEIIGSHWFRNTKRCREFLQYAVAETLAVRAAKLYCCCAAWEAMERRAAGEFVSRPDLLSTFVHQTPVGWQRKNFQIVVEVDLINGSAGQPHVLETYFW